MIVKEVLDKTISFFKQKNIETPRLDAELIMAHGLDIDRMQVYLRYDQPLKEDELAHLRELVKRRSQGEPIAYITGKKDFYKSTFIVNSSVLIPRPETETLVEIAVEKLEQKFNEIKNNSESVDKIDFNILELGAGTGCISISLAKEFPDFHFFAVEKSAETFKTLLSNQELNPCENLKLIEMDAELEERVITESSEGFDLIISNPPYIDRQDLEISPEVKKYEPEEALFADNKGLYFIQSWIQKYQKFLNPNGIFLFEIGYQQGSELENY
ncbi:MAG: peptide chain release factor N(5)-glutamine methyltransferase, partial [Bdellovibrionales bacterium]|nr:peptide chain release factor N(5)-glutamine methyltransferase [Bdellovibrionales bacterium]